MKNNVNDLLNWKDSNSSLPHRWMAACLRHMMQNKKENKWDEVQHEVTSRSQKYPAVPQLGFIFYNTSEEFLEIYSLYLWASSPRHISSLDTSRTQQQQKKRKKQQDFKQRHLWVCDLVVWKKLQIFALDLLQLELS